MGCGERALDRWAPLSPNAWLRFDVVDRMLPAGIDDVLEVGCGQGALGTRLALRYRYLGIEPDLNSLAVARQRMARLGRGEVRQGDVTAVGAECFDLVCAFEVLEHIDDDEATLAAWIRRLRPGGWLLLSVPAHPHRYGPADRLVGHVRRYDPSALAAMLARTGLDRVEVRPYGAPLGYLLEAGRNLIARQRLPAARNEPIPLRTAASGRLLQPGGPLCGLAARGGTAPFRLLQRALPDRGPGLVARGRLPRSG